MLGSSGELEVYLYENANKYYCSLSTELVICSVAPIIGLATGYRPIIGVVMHNGISCSCVSLLDFFILTFDFVVFSKHETLTCSAHT